MSTHLLRDSISIKYFVYKWQQTLLRLVQGRFSPTKGQA